MTDFNIFLLCGGSHVQSSLLPKLALLFGLVSTCWGSKCGVTTSSSSCLSSWTTTRSWRGRARIGSACSTGTLLCQSLQCAWRSGRLMGEGGNCHEHTSLHIVTLFFLFSMSKSRGPRSLTRVQVSDRMPGYVLQGQPTEILRVFVWMLGYALARQPTISAMSVISCGRIVFGIN